MLAVSTTDNGMYLMRIMSSAFLTALGIEYLALGRSRGAKPEGFENERVVVLLLSLLVGPVVGPDTRLDNELVAFESVLGYRFAQGAEGGKPQARDNLAGGTLLIPPGIVVANQAKPRIQRIALGNELGIAGQVPDGSQLEAVHDDPP
jgi:hypothetical protein